MTRNHEIFDLPFAHLDDNSFNLTLFEMSQGIINFNSNRLESLYFNPLYLVESIASTADLDPDQQFFCEHNSRHYVPDQFNDRIGISNESPFSLMHINIRSLNQNLDKLTDLLSVVNLDFDIIGICETWFHDAKDAQQIVHYNFVHNY